MDHERLRELISNNPALTLQQLADEFGCSRERIRQVIKHLNITGRMSYRGRRSLEVVLCSQCKQPTKFFLAAMPAGHARTHRITQPEGKLCLACRRRRVELQCDNCGSTFSMRPSDYTGAMKQSMKRGRGLSKQWYCSRGCFIEGERNKPQQPNGTHGTG